MALDPRYVVTIDLEEYFVDKDTGQPLSFGTIEFWQDDNRAVPKLVFELTGAPPNYAYVPLPNPITLSSVGTISDNNGNNVPIYYFPYDDDGNVQLYYIVVKNSLGVIQFTREGWPNTTAIDNPVVSQAGLSNQLSNPQFVDVSFLPTNPLTITFAGAGITTVAIAPKWDLVINSVGAGTVTVLRTAVAGIAAYPANPPYTLTITPGLNVNGLQLRQRLNNNPDLFSRAAGGVNGYISASVLLAPLSNVTISYQPNTQPAQVILNANNVGGNYAEFNNTIQLTPAANPTTADTGYVDILVTLPIAVATTLSNLQIVGLNSNVQGVLYEEVASNRERDQLFNYYNPLLQYKPIKSYLIGWDFPLNPAQPLGAAVAASAAGANSSSYAWDQTIVFQSANNGAASSRAPSGALRVTATNATQFALVQYLPQSIAREILNNPLSANVSALTAAVGGLVGTISLWYTNNAALPNIAANASLVTTLDANGKPNAVAVGWSEVTRNGLGNAQFTVGNSATTNFNDYGFSGWNLNGIAAVNTTTFFAIVVGFAPLGAAASIDIQSVSLVPGSIPTKPAPQTISEVLMDCCHFYQKTFNQSVVPGQGLGSAGPGVTGDYIFPGFAIGGNATARGNSIYLNPPMNTSVTGAIPIITTYNPVNANAQVYDYTFGADCSATAVAGPTAKSFQISCTNLGGTFMDFLGVHWTADARLGL